ncbi:hypothetical protein C8R44DRAFT_890533 [Mycena epipterygia]|nr:hypothetical protein C8R44DRAFT_890533 [Mycena epipterygia]
MQGDTEEGESDQRSILPFHNGSITTVMAIITFVIFTLHRRIMTIGRVYTLSMLSAESQSSTSHRKTLADAASPTIMRIRQDIETYYRSDAYAGCADDIQLGHKMHLQNQNAEANDRVSEVDTVVALE